MTVTRRSVLQSALLVAAAGSAGPVGALTGPCAALVVFDSRVPQSSSFRARLCARAVDVAVEHATRWRSLREWRSSGRVVGLTAWSDLVLVRGLLEEQRKRLRTEVRCGKLFYWEMA
jgi:hypothetical protein